MKKVFLLFVFLFAAANTFSQVYVSGYTKSNGTYVKPYYRTSPNHTRNDNYSTKGNINPYTGEYGTKPRDYGSTYITPSYTNPSYTTPSYTTPTYTTPIYVAPSYTTPSYTAPTYTMPTYTTPSYIAPSYTAPSYRTPSYTAPTYTLPSYLAPTPIYKYYN